MNHSMPGLPVHHQLPELMPNSLQVQPPLSSIISCSLLKFMFIESVMLTNHLNLSHPLLPSIFTSISVFFNESALHLRWPKYWSFSNSSSSEYSGLISSRIDWFDLLPVWGILNKSLLQYHNLKPSILWHSALSMVQLSHPYITTGKTIAKTRWIFVGKVMSLFLVC